MTQKATLKKTHDEGVIKYNCRFSLSAAPEGKKVHELLVCRDALFALGMVGVYPDGISFGNVSVRSDENPSQFIVTGTQTGHKKKLDTADLCTVTGYDIRRNTVSCEGPVAASSEALTHAMFYSLDEAIGAVIHVHSQPLWLRGQNTLPSTPSNISYGTPQIAHEVARLYETTRLKEVRVLVMAGHEDGILSFGSNLAEAKQALEDALRRLTICARL